MNEKKGKVGAAKDELVYLVSQRIPGASRAGVKAIIDILFDQIADIIAEGRRVQITGFGTFTSQKRSARVGRNPHTNEIITIPSKYIPIFKPSTILRKKVAATRRK